MNGERIYRWREANGQGLEHLVFRETPAPHARSVVTTPDGVFAYEVDLDEAWRVRRLRVLAESSDTRLELVSDGAGHWRANGTHRADLAAAIDIDLELTPFTNTLPIRRLGLAVGESADIVTAWVAFPSLDIHPDPQRYTRLSVRTWLYESRDSDFRREITVDPEGFVLSYPDLFERVDL